MGSWTVSIKNTALVSHDQAIIYQFLSSHILARALYIINWYYVQIMMIRNFRKHLYSFSSEPYQSKPVS